MNSPKYLNPKNIDERYGNYLGTFNISSKHLGKIFSGYEDACLLDTFTQLKDKSSDPNYFGMMNAEGANALIGILKAMKPKTIFEIGTSYGLMTKHMCLALPESKIFTLDIGPSGYDFAKNTIDRWNRGYVANNDSDVGRAYREAGLENKITQFINDSATFDFSPYYGKIDFVLVDGDHGYKGAKHDLEEAFKIVSPNGLVAVDDYGRLHHSEGVVLAVLEAVKDGREFYFLNHKDGPKTEIVFHLPEFYKK